MAGQTPHLPALPSGFGMDSSYPPMPGSTRVTASQPKPPAAVAATVSPPRPYHAAAGPPPLQPHPPGALEQEQLRRRQQPASYSSSPSVISPNLRPGQFVHAPAPAPTPPPIPPQHHYAQPSSSSHQFVGGFASHPQPPPQQYRASTPVSAPRPPPSMPNPGYGYSDNSQGLRVTSGSYGQSSGARRASAVDAYATGPAPLPQASTSSVGQPALACPLPDVASLAAQKDRARDEKLRVQWAKQMLKYVERNFSDGTRISEPNTVAWTDEAISIIILNAASNRPEPEALYLRGDLQASGAFPTYLPKNLKEAFNDFELSARMGWAPSWFRIGRDYEVLGDLARARDAYDRGGHSGDVGCIYRMGMANLLGQLELPVNYPRAIAMLREAADKADLDTPQPAYIYGMLLAGEFSHVDVPQRLLRPVSTSVASVEDDARRHIQRAAYLNFAQAQYKCGWLFEYAQLGCAFDPLLSVQYYSLASQGGEIEADMALSKWFLCGAESYFEKDEKLAYTFADKAARKGLASAEFALGYYHEVGVGTPRNVELARKWYQKAAAKDNADAVERLQALQGPQANGFTRQQHEAVMDDKLVRKRTMAKALSDREGRSPAVEHDHYFGESSIGQRIPSGQTPAVPSNANPGRPVASGSGGGGNLDLSRKKTMKMVAETAAGRKRPNYNFEGKPRRDSAVPSMPVAPAHPRPAPSNMTPPGTRVSSGTQPSTHAGRHGAGYTLNDSGHAPASAPATHSHTNAWAAVPPAPKTAESAPTDYSKKPYNTFAEMGFAPQKQKKEECVVC